MDESQLPRIDAKALPEHDVASREGRYPRSTPISPSIDMSKRLVHGLQLALLVAATLVAPTSARAANAPDVRFFGVELNRPVPFPECQKRTVGMTTYYPDYIHPIASCWKGNKYDASLKEVLFSRNDCPSLVAASCSMDVRLVNERVVAIELYTVGVSVQERDFQQLQSKYGKPGSVSKSQVSNFSGSKFESTNALWVFDDVIVEQRGVEERLDRGRITVQTPGYRATQRLGSEAGRKELKM